MRFEVERQARKPASSNVASALLVLWSVMSMWGEATRVGAEVRPEAVEAEDETGRTCERSRVCEQGSAGAGERELPERVRAFPRTW